LQVGAYSDGQMDRQTDIQTPLSLVAFNYVGGFNKQ